MKVEIITDSEPFKRSLERYLDVVFSGIEFPNLILVDASCILNPSQKRTDRAGIRIAKDYAGNKKNIVIILSFESEKSLSQNDPDFGGLMSLPNVGFVDILRVHGIIEEYKRLSSGEKKEDLTGSALYEFKSLERAISGLRHDLHYALDDESRFTNWIKRAHNAGIAGTDEEIISYVKNFTPQTSGRFEGKYLEGIFIDALDTLFDKDWEVVEKVKLFVEELSTNTKKIITVISDSDENFVKTALKKGGLSWKNFSKFALRGVKLEIMIDDLSEDEFEKTYKISAEKFISVSEIL